MIIIDFMENHWLLVLMVAIFLIILASIMRAPVIDEDAILERARKKERYILVTDVGDPSVGIYPRSWQVELPFTIDLSDTEQLEHFRAAIIDVYIDYCDGRCRADYDFELMFKEEFD